MNTLNDYVAEYIEYCEYRKRLDRKTLKAYRIDLKQYADYLQNISEFYYKDNLDKYITHLHKQYKPKTVKRKIASLKAFFHYLEYKEIISENPFSKLDIRFREAKLLPKTIPFHSLQTFLSALYQQKEQVTSEYQLRCCIRDIAVIELLFATGMRISELCSLRPADIDFISNNVLIYGKGAKERILQIGNPEVLLALSLYHETFKSDIDACGYFFVDRLQKKLSDQSVRYMITRYAKLAGIEQHLTPHMFRHILLADPENPERYREMPVLEDVFNILKKNPDTRRLANIMNRLVHGSASTFNQQTNVNLDNKYTVLDISELTGDLLTVGMFVALDYV